MPSLKKTIGIFALQGAFIEHKQMIEKLGYKVVLVRDMKDVEDCEFDGIILPGGESTTMNKLLKKTGLYDWLVEFVKNGGTIFGTCAGMIILSQMGLIDIEVDRNAYGSQLDSFEDKITLEDGKKFHGIFIRAPKIKSIGKGVKILGKHEKVPVFVNEKSVYVSSFHPELTGDSRVHRVIF